METLRILCDRAIFFWIRLANVWLRTSHISGEKQLPVSENELIVVSLTRNSQVYIDTFINHYTSLGAKWIVLLDNGSTDDTVELAKKYPEVSIYSCTLPFKKYNLLFRQFLKMRFGKKNHWILNVDIDELFDYPYSNQLDMGDFLEYLNTKKYTCMVSYILDMFSEKTLSSLDTLSGNIKESCQYSDISSINQSDYPSTYPGYSSGNSLIKKIKLDNILNNPAIKYYAGGIRGRIFNMPGICLIKHPLIFIDGKTKIVHPHYVNHARIADITGVLFHYKFVNGFHERINDALKYRQYWNNSFEYNQYSKIINNNPDIALKTANAFKPGNANNLIASDVIQVTKDYELWCKNNQHKTNDKTKTIKHGHVISGNKKKKEVYN